MQIYNSYKPSSQHRDFVVKSDITSNADLRTIQILILALQLLNILHIML
jgi:hypothetical protein